MTREESLWLWLHYGAGNDAHAFYDILQQFSDPEEIFDAVKNRDMEALESIPKEARERLIRASDAAFLKQYLGWLMKNGIGILTPESEQYPIALTNLDAPPPVLFYKGTLPKDFGLTVGLSAGADPSAYAVSAAKQFLDALLEGGASVVTASGEALESGILKDAPDTPSQGRVISVLPAGIDQLTALVPIDAIQGTEENVLFLSPFLPRTEKSRETKRMQTELMLDLVDAVVLLDAESEEEAKAKIWRLKEMQKPVFAIPGSILDKRSMLLNRLIQMGEAEMAADAMDLFAAFPEKAEIDPDTESRMVKKIPFSTLSDPMQRIYMALRQRDMDLDTLSEFVDLDPDTAEDAVEKMLKGNILRYKQNKLMLDSYHTSITFTN